MGEKIVVITVFAIPVFHVAAAVLNHIDHYLKWRKK